MATPFNPAAILAAQNPHPQYGYFHGPIPNHNVTGWVPAEQEERVQNGRQPLGVTAEQNARSPNSRVLVSKFNGGICMTETAPGSGIMCGKVFEERGSYWRHQRDFHVGAINSPRAVSIPPQEAIAGDLAMRKFVLTGAWRKAQFLHEPGYGPQEASLSKIHQIADQYEALARTDRTFAELWGKDFNREGVRPVPRKMKKRHFSNDDEVKVHEEKEREEEQLAPARLQRTQAQLMLSNGSIVAEQGDLADLTYKPGPINGRFSVLKSNNPPLPSIMHCPPLRESSLPPPVDPTSSFDVPNRPSEYIEALQDPDGEKGGEPKNQARYSEDYRRSFETSSLSSLSELESDSGIGPEAGAGGSDDGPNGGFQAGADHNAPTGDVDSGSIVIQPQLNNDPATAQQRPPGSAVDKPAKKKRKRLPMEPSQRRLTRSQARNMGVIPSDSNSRYILRNQSQIKGS